MKISTIKAIIFTIIIAVLYLPLVSCSAVNSLQNITDIATGNIFSKAQAVPKLNLQFDLPNNWETDDIHFSSLGVQQSPLPIPVTIKKSNTSPSSL